MHPILARVKLSQELLFASNAELAVLGGVLLLLLAAATRYGERRRLQRERIDRVGWVPWTGLFLIFSVLGVTLLGLAIPGLLKG